MLEPFEPPPPALTESFPSSPLPLNSARLKGFGTRYHRAAIVMALKKSFLNLDYRHLMLPVVFSPFIIWISAIVMAIAFWGRPGSFAFACVLLFVGGLIARWIPALEYRLARLGLTEPLPGTAGKDYLLFAAEDPATIHKLKLFSEDGGFLFTDDHGYRLITLLHDYHIPFENFHQELILHKGETKAIRLRFQPADSAQTVELAISCTYAGNNIEIAGSIAQKNEWAAKVIAALNRRKSPPPLPPGATVATSPA